MTMPLTDQLICPDCGGELGGTGADGVKPCTCFAEKKPAAVGRVLADPQTVDPAAVPDAPAGAPPKDAKASKKKSSKGGPPKPCVVCGKDLRGHRRLKDERGYLCLDCSKQEKGTEAERGTCAECGRRVKKVSLQRWGTVRICKQCAIEHERDPRRHVRKIDAAVFKQADWGKIYAAAAVIGLLLLFLLIHWLGWL